MNDLKKKWIDTLRSGQYEQGVGFLRTEGNKFCCLGVLCDIIDPTQWKLDELEDGSVYSYIYSRVNPPESAMIEAGYPGDESAYDEMNTLVELNDNEGYTFEQIADFLETGEFRN